MQTALAVLVYKERQHLAVHCRQSLLWKAASLPLQHLLLRPAAQGLPERGRHTPQLPRCARRHSSYASFCSC